MAVELEGATHSTAPPCSDSESPKGATSQGRPFCKGWLENRSICPSRSHIYMGTQDSRGGAVTPRELRSTQGQDGGSQARVKMQTLRPSVQGFRPRWLRQCVVGVSRDSQAPRRFCVGAPRSSPRTALVQAHTGVDGGWTGTPTTDAAPLEVAAAAATYDRKKRKVAVAQLPRDHTLRGPKHSSSSV